jgi:hypothetical protein
MVKLSRLLPNKFQAPVIRYPRENQSIHEDLYSFARKGEEINLIEIRDRITVKEIEDKRLESEKYTFLLIEPIS